ncbi:MAG TPA: hypothetical protein PLM81_02515 [Ginsengibacter sp.]|nr:hypothetical protein [Ginsengibacter sp.]HRP44060.1 hypothetical protein [Ginsengibacter sp.]
MSFRKKFYILSLIIVGIGIIGSGLFTAFLSNTISKFTSGKMEGMGSLMGLTNVPVFKTGVFSEDGKYFAYTFQPEVEMPDVDASITIRGMAFPTYFQVMETTTGRKLTEGQYKTGKSDQMYVIWTEGDEVWLMRSVYHEGNQLALYDMKVNKFRFDFGELEKLNPSVDWKSTNRFFVNTSGRKGVLLEANDKRNYRIDPVTGKAETVMGKFDMVEYIFADDFQVSDRIFSRQFGTKEINGSRQSITTNNGKTISQDDFIEVNFLTLSKNKTAAAHSDAPITYYKNNFFVLSPIASDNEVDMELSMLDKTSLKTIWKIQLPQKKLKTMIPRYGFERFFIKADQMLVSNNDYLMTIDLNNGKIIKQENLYD